MRFAARSKVSILLSAITILTLVSGFMVTALFSREPASHAASGPATATYHGTLHKGTVISSAKPHGKVQHHTASKPKMITWHSPAKKGSASHVSGAGAPAADDVIPLLRGHTAEGHLLQNFNGISDLDQALLNGFEVTPPDQGLCVGTDPASGTKQVFELVNSAVRETNPDGTVDPTSLLGPFGGTVTLSFFFEPLAFSDPRCFYDTRTATFYFTVIGFNAVTDDTTVDIAVYNADAPFFSVVQIDTSEAGACFGDQPHVGLDHDNVVVSTDQFCVTGYLGAAVFVISKSQLDNHLVPFYAEFDNVSLGGIPVLTMQPIISTDATHTEYLMNSFPYDQFGNANTLENFLGFWQIDNGEKVTDGDLDGVVLAGKVIRSETYGFPLPAASTGDGAIVDGGLAKREAFLDAGDSRMQQCQLVHKDIWCALDTAVSIKHDPSARDGIAWFKIEPKDGRVDRQGYVASAGNYLLYPAILATTEGTVTITFSITSPSLDPSAAYVVRKSEQKSFGAIHVTALGFDAHQSFSDLAPFFRPRWGDYSAEALDPNGTDIWGATEYIPPLIDQDPVDNWGTRVFEVMGDH